MKATTISLALLAGSLGSAQATIVGGAVTTGSGSFVELGIPFTESDPDTTVGNNTFQNPNLYAFNERQNVNSGSGIAVDLLPGGGAGTIAANTIVASHYVFFDPAGSTSQEGWVDFDSAILGVATSQSTLAGSDAYVNLGVTYLNPGLRGLESGDSVTIGDGGVGSVPGGRLFVDWRASSPGDYVRVFTAVSPGAVPDGGSMALLLGGALLGLAGFRRIAARS